MDLKSSSAFELRGLILFLNRSFSKKQIKIRLFSTPRTDHEPQNILRPPPLPLGSARRRSFFSKKSRANAYVNFSRSTIAWSRRYLQGVSAAAGEHAAVLVSDECEQT